MKKVINKAINKVNQIMDVILISFFRLVPIKDNYIVLESEGDFTDNARVFYDFMIENDLNNEYKIIWIVHNPNMYNKEKNVVFVSRFNKLLNIKAMYYAGVSKYFIFTHPYWFKNWRKKQKVIFTTHSVAQLKDAGEKDKYKIADYVLCCSDYCQKIKEHTLGIEKKYIIPIGMPRIDLMYKSKSFLHNLIDNYDNEKIILDMETFRQSKGWKDSNHINKYGLNVIKSKNELLNLNQYFLEHKEILIVKLHHLQDSSFLTNVNLSNIKYLYDSDLNKIGIQTNDLLAKANILLTDYSSVFYEFLLTNKPIGFLISDFDEYSRGFLMEDPLSEMPGEKITNYEELINFFENIEFGEDTYAEERTKIKSKVFKYYDSNNCRRLFEFMQTIK